ncbi:hypothetical protein CW736_03335 [Nonlabens sp. MB-3u-79]|nr:hypothetical protein CW736_03335 [Nonlabens sp. MB-3u-79]
MIYIVLVALNFVSAPFRAGERKQESIELEPELELEIELEPESILKSQYKENSGPFLWKGFRIG